MSTLVTLEFEEPTVPAREYLTNPGRTVKTKERTKPGAGDVVVDNPSVDEYKVKRKVYSDQVLTWKENKAKCYYLVLSHCPRALKHQLKNSSKWEETEGNQDVVALLKMIKDITHNKKERKESVMTTVESDAEIYTINQGSGESLLR